MAKKKNKKKALAFGKASQKSGMPGIRFETFVDSNGEARWRMVDGNNRIVGVSGEGFTRRADANRAIDNIVNDIRNSPDTPKVEKAKAAK